MKNLIKWVAMVMFFIISVTFGIVTIFIVVSSITASILLIIGIIALVMFLFNDIIFKKDDSKVQR